MDTPKVYELAREIFSDKATSLSHNITKYWGIYKQKKPYSYVEKDTWVTKQLLEVTSPIWEVVESILDCPEDLEVVNAWGFISFDFGKVVLRFGDTGFGYGISPKIWNNNQEYTLLLEAFHKAKEYNSGVKQRALLKEMFEDE